MYSYYQFVVFAIDFKIFHSTHLLDQHEVYCINQVHSSGNFSLPTTVIIDSLCINDTHLCN